MDKKSGRRFKTILIAALTLRVGARAASRVATPCVAMSNHKPMRFISIKSCSVSGSKTSSLEHRLADAAPHLPPEGHQRFGWLSTSEMRQPLENVGEGDLGPLKAIFRNAA
jgi:hypothetical protein